MGDIAGRRAKVRLRQGDHLRPRCGARGMQDQRRRVVCARFRRGFPVRRQRERACACPLLQAQHAQALPGGNLNGGNVGALSDEQRRRAQVRQVEVELVGLVRGVQGRDGTPRGQADEGARHRRTVRQHHGDPVLRAYAGPADHPAHAPGQIGERGIGQRCAVRRPDGGGLVGPGDRKTHGTNVVSEPVKPGRSRRADCSVYRGGEAPAAHRLTHGCEAV